MQRLLDQVRIEVEQGRIFRWLGHGQPCDGIVLLGFEGVGIDLDLLDHEGAGLLVVIGYFGTVNLVPAERPGQNEVDDQRDPQRAENPALLQTLQISMDSN